jgi:hypothetical protein
LDGYKQVYQDIFISELLQGDMKEQYKIRNVYFIGHNNGRIFGLMLALYTPNILTTIATHIFGIGFDRELHLNYLVLTKKLLLFYTEKEDLYKETCESAKNILKRRICYC